MESHFEDSSFLEFLLKPFWPKLELKEKKKKKPKKQFREKLNSRGN